MAKVTGIGGVFFKSTGDHKKLSELGREEQAVTTITPGA